MTFSDLLDCSAASEEKMEVVAKFTTVIYSVQWWWVHLLNFRYCISNKICPSGHSYRTESPDGILYSFIHRPRMMHRYENYSKNRKNTQIIYQHSRQPITWEISFDTFLSRSFYTYIRMSQFKNIIAVNVTLCWWFSDHFKINQNACNTCKFLQSAPNIVLFIFSFI